MDDEGTSPKLPPLPLSDLTLSDSFDASSVWASTTSHAILSPSVTNINSISSSSQANSPLPSSSTNKEGFTPNVDVSDLDPYAPSPLINSKSLGLESKPLPPPFERSPTQTLGSSVLPHSKLELISDSDAFSSPEHSPTEGKPTRPLPPIKDSISPPFTPPKPVGRILSGSEGSGLFSIFRGGNSTSGGSTVKQGKVTATGAEEEKAGLRQDYSEKHHQRTPSDSVNPSPIASTSSISNPLTTFASAFRSATSSRASSQAGTPPPRSSVDKSSYLDSENKGKERNKEKVSEKGKEDKEVGSEMETEVVFDFNKFLEQMRLRSADPVAKYLRSFLKEFTRRPPVSTSDQIRVINDFLDFIAGKMRTVEPWKSVVADRNVERGEAEFDMAMEAMEKLVMNRVWSLTFTPAIDLNTVPGHISPTDDLERDHVLNQRIRLFSWIKPCHLDLPLTTPSTTPESSQPMTLVSSDDSSPTIEVKNEEDSNNSTTTSKEAHQQKQTQGFLDFARRELVKINQYKAPRDKLICVLNSCKVIFGLIRHLSSEEGADAFIPFLIYIVLKANPEHLVSNIHYIQRFRNPEKLSGEGGYYLSSLNGALSFIETMDASSLSNITQAEFEDNVEKAILNLPLPIDPSDNSTMRIPTYPLPLSINTVLEPAHSTSSDLASATDVQSSQTLGQSNLSFPDATKAFFIRSTDSVERIVSKPLGAIGRIFDQFDQEIGNHLPSTLSLDHSNTSAPSSPTRVKRSQSRSSVRSAHSTSGSTKSRDPHAGLYLSDDLSTDQVTKEIDRQHEEQRMAAIETLESVFPNLEREVLEMVLLSNSGEMAATIDSLLEMS